jgi:hypothetical protein
MKALDMADLSLVTLKDGYPYCKKHGAMNSVGRYDKNGVAHFIWRCIHTYRFYPEDTHLPVEQRRHDGNPCRAGCVITCLPSGKNDTERGRKGQNG